MLMITLMLNHPLQISQILFNLTSCTGPLFAFGFFVCFWRYPSTQKSLWEIKKVYGANLHCTLNYLRLSLSKLIIAN